MRARRVDGSEFRLFQDEQEIGQVDSTAVSFRGFDTPDDAPWQPRRRTVR